MRQSHARKNTTLHLFWDIAFAAASYFCPLLSLPWELLFALNYCLCPLLLHYWFCSRLWPFRMLHMTLCLSLSLSLSLTLLAPSQQPSYWSFWSPLELNAAVSAHSRRSQLYLLSCLNLSGPMSFRYPSVCVNCCARYPLYVAQCIVMCCVEVCEQ